MSDFGRMATAVVSGAAGTTTLVLEKARLRVVGGPDKGKEVVIDALPLHIGTGGDNDLRLTDPTVSSHHAMIDLDVPRGFRIRDLGSTNGILVEKYRVYDAVLAPGMVLRLGATEIKVVPSKERREVQLSGHDRFGSLVGGSVKMRELYAVLERVSQTDSTLLIEGETGTGKELAAESVHAASRRGAAGQFVVFDCGAAPPTLIEAELFGFERGAFTGAVQAKAGLFEEADGGTIFLDEVGELDLALQPKLLRVLERREVRRIGSTRTQTVDVRVIAATNRSLDAEVRAGRFREDLLYRLAVVRVRMPPLRERRDDIPMLVENLLDRFPGGRPSGGLPAGSLELLSAHSWPGNVRELRNVVERLIAMPDSAPFERELLAVTTGGLSSGPSSGGATWSNLPLPEARRRAVEAFERGYVSEVLGRCAGNVTRAATDAGVSRQFLTRLIARYRLRGE